jgi:hypothetical protein
MRTGDTKKASPERFEHSRAKHNRCQLNVAGDPVNHSGKVTYFHTEHEDIRIGCCPIKNLRWRNSAPVLRRRLLRSQQQAGLGVENAPFARARSRRLGYMSYIMELLRSMSTPF